MNEKLISRAFAGIDGAYVAESEDFAAVRAEVSRARSRRRAAVLSVSAALIALVSVGLALRAGLRRETAPQTTAQAVHTELVPGDGNGSPSSASAGGSAPAAGASSPTAAGTPDATAGYSLPSAGSYGGDGTGWFSIPRLPEDRRIEVTGEELTDGEAAAYFRENLGWIAQSIGAKSLRVEEKGYCHVAYYGVEGRPFELKQNFRDYLAYDGEKLAAILTLVKEDGKLSCTPAFGAPWFDAFDALLKKHAGQTLVFVYAGPTEIAVAPDGQYYWTTGGELPRDFGFEAIGDLYGLFWHEKAAYRPFAG